VLDEPYAILMPIPESSGTTRKVRESMSGLAVIVTGSVSG
jgi:hypothetical protein